jgi:hypothetical protein
MSEENIRNILEATLRKACSVPANEEERREAETRRMREMEEMEKDPEWQRLRRRADFSFQAHNGNNYYQAQVRTHVFGYDDDENIRKPSKWKEFYDYVMSEEFTPQKGEYYYKKSSPFERSYSELMHLFYSFFLDEQKEKELFIQQQVRVR